MSAAARLSPFLILGLAACSPAAPPREKAPPPATTADPCIAASRIRAAARADLDAGKLWRASRALAAADAGCPAGAAETAALRAEALIDLGELAAAREVLSRAPSQDARRIEARLPEAERSFRDLSPEATVEAGLAALTAHRDAEAQRLFDRALSRVERDGGEPLHVGIRDGLEGDAKRIVWTPDDRIVVAHGGLVTILDVGTGREILRKKGPPFVDALSPDGKWLFAIRESPELYDLARRAPGPPLELPRGLEVPTFLSAAFSQDGRLVAVGTMAFGEPRSRQGALVWEAATGKLVAELDGSAGDRAVVFSPSGALLAVGNGVGTVSVWEIASRKKLLTVRGWSDAELRAVQPDATQLMDRSIDSLAFLPDETAIGAVWEGRLHVTSLPRRPKPRRGPGLLVTTGAHNRYPLIDLATEKLAEEPWLSWDSLLAKSPRGERFAVVSGHDVLVAEHGREIGVLLEAIRLRGPHHLEFSDDGSELRVHGYHGARTWPSGRELPKTKPVAEKERQRLWKERLGLVVKGDDLVREASGEVVASCGGPVIAVAVSPDGRRLAVACRRAQAYETQIYDTAAPGRRLVTMRELEKRPVVLVTAPDGRFDILGKDEALERQMVCAVGQRAFPLAVCAERLRAPGLLEGALR